MATVANPLNFFKEAQVELAKVIWPTRQEAIKLTAVVIGVSVAVGLYVGGLDILFTRIMAMVIK
jgi:preprotein translocase subunit SecE